MLLQSCAVRTSPDRRRPGTVFDVCRGQTGLEDCGQPGWFAVEVRISSSVGGLRFLDGARGRHCSRACRQAGRREPRRWRVALARAHRPRCRRLSVNRRGPTPAGFPVSIWRNRVGGLHWSPPIRKVASQSPEDVGAAGLPAKTVALTAGFGFFLVYSGPMRGSCVIHGGLRSIGVCALRTSGAQQAPALGSGTHNGVVRRVRARSPTGGRRAGANSGGDRRDRRYLAEVRRTAMITAY